MDLNTRFRAAAVLTAAACAVPSAFAADGAMPCERDPRATGMSERMEAMQVQVTRARDANDRDEQQRILELHAKHMHESLRQLRGRDLDPRCRAEMLQSLVEQLIVHQETAHELRQR